MSTESNILVKVDNFVFGLFKSSNTENLLFHNYKHTYDVTVACKEIGIGSNLSNEELETIQLAALFHDVGYLESSKNHEELSIKVAIDFLKKEKYADKKIEQVKELILATKMGNSPTNLMEEIISDGDLSGLGHSTFPERTKLLREECSALRNIKFNDKEWLQNEIDFLTKHQYHTKYAQLNFNETKSKNLISKKNDLAKINKADKAKADKSKKKEKELNIKSQKADIPEKGIETMFRTALKNHMELSSIADNKANIMLSINALVLSIIISSIFSKFDKHPELIIPTIAILTVCLSAIVLATLSTQPKITAGKFSPDDVKNRKANLLFFGNFHKMKLEDYEWGMKEMMKDKDYLYSSLIRDLHSLGFVLAKKYTYLRWCYFIFMYGIIISIALYAIAISKASYM